MQYSSFFNAEKNSKGQYDRSYKAGDFAEYFSSFIGNGIFAVPSSNLQVQAGPDATIIINQGSAFISGYYYNNTESITMNLPEANGTYNFIANIVVELDVNNREIILKIISGTPSPNPIAPTLVKLPTLYQLCIAQVSILAGTSSISALNIKDTRFINDLCGIVVSTVQQVDTTTLYNQWNAGFEEWFNLLKEEYEKTPVGAIQTELQTLIKAVTNLNTTYLTTNSEANIENPWSFNGISILESGALNFLNSKSTNLINFNILNDTFMLQNSQTNSNIYEITPGANDQVVVNANTTFKASVNFEDIATNELTVNKELNYENGYVVNYECEGMAQLQNSYNSKAWTLSNESTSNDIIEVTPSEIMGQDKVTLNCPVQVNNELTSLDFNVYGKYKSYNQDLFNAICNQSGSLTVQGVQVDYVVTAWILSANLQSGLSSTMTGYLGVLGVNLKANGEVKPNGVMTIPLSGNPLDSFNVSSSLGINLPHIQINDPENSFYISGLSPNEITLDTWGDNGLMGERTLRCLISN